jgi:hypothetical protein
MKLMAILAALVLITAAPISQTEQDKKTAEQQRKAEEKLRKDEAAKAKDVEKYKKRFTTTYDKFKDITHFKTGYMPLEVATNFKTYTDTLHFGISIKCAGEKFPCAQPMPTIYFAGRSKDWRFLRNYSLIILANSERLLFENVSRGGEIEKGTSVYSGVRVLEYVIAEATIEQLEKIAAADTVEFQLGFYESKLTPAEIAVVAEVVKTLKYLP